MWSNGWTSQPQPGRTRRSRSLVRLWAMLAMSLPLGAVSCAHTGGVVFERFSLHADTLPEAPLSPGSLVGLLSGNHEPLGLTYARPASRGETANKWGTNAVTSLWTKNDPLGNLVLTLFYGPLLYGMGAAVGAAITPSAAAVEEARTTLVDAWEAARVADTFETRVVAEMREHTGVSLISLSTPLAVGSREPSEGPAPAREALEAILVLLSPQARLERRSITGGDGPNPELSLVLAGRLLLLRNADGVVLYDVHFWKHVGPVHTFTEWGADNADRFRTELNRALQTLAEELVVEGLSACLTREGTSEGQ